MTRALILSFLSGFVALSYEILWYRTYSFTTATRADAFALMLGAYLGGLALGSLYAALGCRTDDHSRRGIGTGFLAVLVILSSVLSYILAPLVAKVVSLGIGWALTLPGVALAAGGMGVLFPVISHYSIPPDSAAGARLSYLYLANILGSTTGSLGTGFILLDLCSFGMTSLVLAAFGLLMAGILLGSEGTPPRRRLLWGAGLLAVGIAAALSRPILFDSFYEKLQLKQEYTAGYRFARVVESRGGVITVDREGRVFGGGIYDGAFNTSLRSDINTLARPYFMQAVHRNPVEVLEIGLSSGSWATVLVALPGIEHLTVIEINPSYLGLIPEYPVVAGLLRNPKVSVVIDDGRRWLFRNPDRKFDMVVANVTYHWRANASNLLSVEFLRLIRAHLKPGGVYLYNTTSSPEVLRTGATEFPYALQVMGFLLVSDSPIRYDLEEWKNSLWEYPINQRPPLDRSNPADRALVDRVVRQLEKQLVSREEILRRTHGARIVTDDNMGTEWSQ